jgi:hypothetical protein
MNSEKQNVTFYLDKKLAERLKKASFEKTGSFKGMSECVTEALEAWLKKSE